MDFMESFTLHDSFWIGLHLDSAWSGDATAVIFLDPIWNHIGAPHTAQEADWPILLIRLPRVSIIQISGYESVSGIQRGIAEATAQMISPSAATRITDHHGGQTSIVHDGEIKVLCYSESGTRIMLKYNEPGP